MTGPDWEALAERVATAAAGHGYTREQVNAWRPRDLADFAALITSLPTPVTAENPAADLIRAASTWTVCDRCDADLTGDGQRSPLCVDCCRYFGRDYACNHTSHRPNPTNP